MAVTPSSTLPAGRDRLRGGGDGVRVDAVVAAEVGYRAGLAEMLETPE
jgi:hypothetical protein